MDTLTATFGAFADPTRRSLLSRLTHGPASVRELAAPFRMSQQAVSKHLAFLERAGLILKRRQGRLHFCELQSARFKEAADWVGDYRRFWEESFDRLDDLLSELKQKDAKHEPKK